MKMRSLIGIMAIIAALFSARSLLAAVNQDGSFSYSYDITIPPGIKGVQPSISLSYNSNGGNGIAGVGWILNGFPRIKMVPSKINQYEYVTENNNNIRLISGNGYCHTEIESYSKFYAGEYYNKGITYWIELKPDGTKYYYGYRESIVDTSPTKISVEGKNIEWALSKVEDIYGNFYTIKYKEGKNELIPDEIVYTDNKNEKPSILRKVKFIYTDRLDKFGRTIYDKSIDVDVRLSDIEIYCNNDKLAWYTINYKSETELTYSYIESIQEHGKGIDMPETKFTYSLFSNIKGCYDKDSYMKMERVEDVSDKALAGNLIQGDYNGDGYPDFVLINNTYETYSSQGNTITASSTLNIIPRYGDGSGNFTKGGTKTYTNDNTDEAYYYGWQENYLTGDFNGDGFSDIIAIKVSSYDHDNYDEWTCMCNYKGHVGHRFLSRTYFSCGNTDSDHSNFADNIKCHIEIPSNLNCYVQSANYYDPPLVSIGDINGDGKSDIIVAWIVQDDPEDSYWGDDSDKHDYAMLEVHPLLSNGDGTFSRGDRSIEKFPAHDKDIANWHLTVGDVNGDGLTDIIGYYLNKTPDIKSVPVFVTSLSYGDGFNSMTLSEPTESEYLGANWDVQATDINNDGRCDMLFVNMGNSDDEKIKIFSFLANDSEGFDINNSLKYVSTESDPDYKKHKYTIGDFNGDGYKDVAMYNILSGSPLQRPSIFYGGKNGIFGFSENNRKPYLIMGNVMSGFKLEAVDINNDGISDLVFEPESGKFKLYYALREAEKQIIDNITEPEELLTKIEYEAYSQEYDKRDFNDYDIGEKSNYLLYSNKQFDYYKYLRVKNVKNGYNTYYDNLPSYNEIATNYYYGIRKKNNGYKYERKNYNYSNLTASTTINDTNIDKGNDVKKRTHMDFSQERIELIGTLTRKYETINNMMKSDETYVYSVNDNYSDIKDVKLTESSLLNYNDKGQHTTYNKNLYTYDDYGNTVRLEELFHSSNGFIGIKTITENNYDPDLISWRLNKLSNNKVTRSFQINGSDVNSQIIENKKITENDIRDITVTRYFQDDNITITTQTFLNNFGNPTSTVDPKGNTTGYSYDSYQTWPTTVTAANGLSTTMTYDPLTGQKTSVTNPDGTSTTYTYDGIGRPTGIKKMVAGSEMELSSTVYDGLKSATTTIKSLAKNESGAYVQNNISVKSEFYDQMGRVYKKEQTYYGSGNNSKKMTTYFNFCENGQLKNKTLPFLDGTPYKIKYYYDQYDRQTKIEKPDGRIYDYTYYDAGIYKAVTEKYTKDEKSFSKVTTTYPFERKVKKKEPNLAEITYQYDLNNNLTKVTTPDTQSITIKYDSLGRKIAMTDPNAGTYTYAYDNNGNMVKQINPLAQMVIYEYDSVNRVKKADYPGEEDDVSYTYDESSKNGEGKLTGVEVGGKFVQKTYAAEYSYDDLGNNNVIKEKFGGKTLLFTMEYDTAGRVTSLTYPDGEKIDREYSDGEFLSKVSWHGDVLAKYGMFKIDSEGKITNDANRDKIYRVTKDGVETEITFNPENYKPVSVVSRMTDADGNPLADKKLEDQTFSYDYKGNIDTITDNMPIDSETHPFTLTQSFTYDELGRIKTANSTEYGNMSYDYDPNGNLTKKDGFKIDYSDTSHPYAATHRYIAGSVKPADANYAYDANGNMIKKGTLGFEYDAGGRLRKVKTGNTVNETFLYDNQGRKILTKRSDGVITYNAEGLYEITVIPGKGENHTKYVLGINNEMVCQLTKKDSELMTFFTPWIIKKFYTKKNIFGIMMLIHGYATWMVWSPAVYKSIALLLMLIIFSFCAYQTAKSISVHGIRRNRRLARTATPASLFFFTSFFGTGCFLDSSSSNGNAPWNEYEEENPIDETIDALASDGETPVNKEGLPEPGVKFFHPDYTGNVSYTTDLNGNVRNRMLYKPYGEVYKQTGTDNFRPKYNSKERDNVTGFVYYGARWYDPEIGRFTTPDPTIPSPEQSQAFNRYMYVCGSPVKFQDFEGYEGTEDSGGSFSAAVNAVCNAISSFFSNSSSGTGSENERKGIGDLKQIENQKTPNEQSLDKAKTILNDSIVKDTINKLKKQTEEDPSREYGGTIRRNTSDPKDKKYFESNDIGEDPDTGAKRMYINDKEILDINGKKYQFESNIHTHPTQNNDTLKESNTDNMPPQLGGPKTPLITITPDTNVLIKLDRSGISNEYIFTTYDNGNSYVPLNTKP